LQFRACLPSAWEERLIVLSHRENAPMSLRGEAMLPVHQWVPVRSRGLCMLLVCAASLSRVVSADPLPASARSCATLTDPAERLACYDREAERPAGQASRASSDQSASDCCASASGGEPHSSAAAQASSQSPAAQSGTDAKSAAAVSGAGAHTRPGSRAVNARVLRIEHSQGGLLLSLDNGQVWQEVQQTAGDLSLRPGDTVQIQRHFGSFFLTGPHVRDMSVRQK
jgi:hypothetical protein